MAPSLTSIEYREIGPEHFDLIRPLWEKLIAFHLQLSPTFAASRSARTFETRTQELLAKSASGPLKVDLVYADRKPAPVAYGITSLASDGTGELDSLFVEQYYRGKGIGTILTQRALAWLDARKALSKVVVVAFGNDSALEFYRQFGFLPERVTLRQASKGAFGKWRADVGGSVTN
jgi:ribosomal protein S18 acetylase RimI-like enzyme